MPAHDEVHLWVVDISDETGDSQQYRVACTPDERDRASRFRNPVDGDRYLAAHGALRLILADYLSCLPRDIFIRTHEHGKPFVAESTIEFNLSHSGTKALIAAASERHVGVDVERIRSIPDMEAVLARIATAEECDAFKTLNLTEQVAEFFRMWTRTEALCKLGGTGLRDLAPPCRELLHRSRLVHVDDLDGYAACVAADGLEWRLVRMPRHPESSI